MQMATLGDTRIRSVTVPWREMVRRLRPDTGYAPRQPTRRLGSHLNFMGLAINGPSSTTRTEARSGGQLHTMPGHAYTSIGPTHRDPGPVAPRVRSPASRSPPSVGLQLVC